MKKRIIVGLLTTILLLAILALSFWASGYNFDYRNAQVGWCVFYSLFFCIGAGIVAANLLV